MELSKREAKSVDAIRKKLKSAQLNFFLHFGVGALVLGLAVAWGGHSVMGERVALGLGSGVLILLLYRAEYMSIIKKLALRIDELEGKK